MLENHRGKLDILPRDYALDPISEEEPRLEADRLERIKSEQAIINARNLELRTSHAKELSEKRVQQEAKDIKIIKTYHTLLDLQSKPDGQASIERYRRQLNKEVAALVAKGESPELTRLQEEQTTFNAIAPPETFERNPLEDKQWRQHLAKVDVDAIIDQLANAWLWELGKKQRLTERLQEATEKYNKLSAEIQTTKQEIAVRTAAVQKTQTSDTSPKQWYTQDNMTEKLPDANVDYDWHPSAETRGTHAKEVHTPETRPRTPEETRVLDTQARIASQEADITSRAKAEVLQNLLASGVSKNEYRAKLDQDIAYFEAESSEFDDESPEMTNLKKLIAQREALNEIAHEEAVAAKTKRETIPTAAEQRKARLEARTRETILAKEAIAKDIARNNKEIAMITKERDALSRWHWIQRGDLQSDITEYKNKNLILESQLNQLFLEPVKGSVKPEYRAPKVEVSARPEISAADLEPFADDYEKEINAAK